MFLAAANNKTEEQRCVPEDIVELCRETFKKTSEYLKGELDGKRMKNFKVLHLFSGLFFSRFCLN